MLFFLVIFLVAGLLVSDVSAGVRSTPRILNIDGIVKKSNANEIRSKRKPLQTSNSSSSARSSTRYSVGKTTKYAADQEWSVPAKCPTDAIPLYGLGRRPMAVFLTREDKLFLDDKVIFPKGRGGIIALYKSQGNSEADKQRLFGYFHGNNDFEFILNRINPMPEDISEDSHREGFLGQWRIELGAQTDKYGTPGSLLFDDTLVSNLLYTGSLIDIGVCGTALNCSETLSSVGPVADLFHIVRLSEMPTAIDLAEKQTVELVFKRITRLCTQDSFLPRTQGNWSSLIAVSLDNGPQNGRLRHGFVMRPSMYALHVASSSMDEENRYSETVSTFSFLDRKPDRKPYDKINDSNNKFLNIQAQVLPVAETHWNEAQKIQDASDTSSNIILEVQGLNKYIFELDARGRKQGLYLPCKNNIFEACISDTGVRFDTRIISSPIGTPAMKLESTDVDLVAAEIRLVEILSRATYFRVLAPHIVASRSGSEGVLVPKLLEIGSDLMEINGVMESERVFLFAVNLFNILDNHVGEPPGDSRMFGELWLWQGELNVSDAKDYSYANLSGVEECPFNLVAYTYVFLGSLDTYPRALEREFVIEVAAVDKEDRGTWFRLRSGRFANESPRLYETRKNSVVELPSSRLHFDPAIPWEVKHKAAAVKEAIWRILERFQSFTINLPFGIITTPEISLSFELMENLHPETLEFLPSLSHLEDSVLPMPASLNVFTGEHGCDAMSAIQGLKFCIRCSLRTPLTRYEFYLRQSASNPGIMKIVQLVGTPKSEMDSLKIASETLETSIEKVAPEFRRGKKNFLEMTRNLMLGAPTVRLGNVGLTSTVSVENNSTSLTFVKRDLFATRIFGRWQLDTIENLKSGVIDEIATDTFVDIISTVNGFLDARFRLAESEVVGLRYRITDHGSRLSSRPFSEPFSLPRLITFDCQDYNCTPLTELVATELRSVLTIFGSGGDQPMEVSVSREMFMDIKSPHGIVMRFSKRIDKWIEQLVMEENFYIVSHFELADSPLIPFRRPLSGHNTRLNEVLSALEVNTGQIQQSPIRRLMLHVVKESNSSANEGVVVLTFSVTLSEVSIFPKCTGVKYGKRDVASFVLDLSPASVVGIRHFKWLWLEAETRPDYPALLEIFGKAMEQHRNQENPSEVQDIHLSESFLKFDSDSNNCMCLYSDNGHVCACPAPARLSQWLKIEQMAAPEQN